MLDPQNKSCLANTQRLALTVPVAPSRVWCRFPSDNPRVRASMASGWSPEGKKGDSKSNRRSLLLCLCFSRSSNSHVGREIAPALRNPCFPSTWELENKLPTAPSSTKFASRSHRIIAVVSLPLEFFGRPRINTSAAGVTWERVANNSWQFTTLELLPVLPCFVSIGTCGHLAFISSCMTATARRASSRVKDDFLFTTRIAASEPQFGVPRNKSQHLLRFRRELLRTTLFCCFTHGHAKMSHDHKDVKTIQESTKGVQVE